MANKLVPEHWYPKATEKRARVDEYMSWQHNNIRYGSTMYFMSKFIGPMKTGNPPNQKEIEMYEKVLNNSLDTIEKVWLGQNEKYLFGKQITIADLMAATEIEQPRIAGFDSLVGRPRLGEYMELVKQTLQPHYDEAHSFMDEMAQEAKKIEEKSLRAKVNWLLIIKIVFTLFLKN